MKTIALVRFTPRAKMSQEEYKAFLIKMMPMFQNAEGLNHKYFTASETGSVGVYEWQSKEAAEAFYNEAWRAQMDKVASDCTVELLPVRAELCNVKETVDYYI